MTEEWSGGRVGVGNDDKDERKDITSLTPTSPPPTPHLSPINLTPSWEMGREKERRMEWRG